MNEKELELSFEKLPETVIQRAHQQEARAAVSRVEDQSLRLVTALRLGKDMGECIRLIELFIGLLRVVKHAWKYL